MYDNEGHSLLSRSGASVSISSYLPRDKSSQLSCPLVVKVDEQESRTKEIRFDVFRSNITWVATLYLGFRSTLADDHRTREFINEMKGNEYRLQ